MRLRSSVGETDPSTRESSPDGVAAGLSGSSSSASPARTLLLVAAGTAAVAYAVSRYVASSDNVPDAPLETVRDRTAAAVPDDVGDQVAEAIPAEPQSIPIGDRGSGAADTETDDESDGPSGATDVETTDASDVDDAGEPIDDEEINADLADEPSATKVSSGSSDEIQEKPAEPGEMAVEEDVEELVDEAIDDSDEDEE